MKEIQKKSSDIPGTPKKAIILGAGQFGNAARQLLDPAVWTVLAFGDNNPASRTEPSGGSSGPAGTAPAGGNPNSADGSPVPSCGFADPPVLSVADALRTGPDLVIIAIRGEDRFRSLEAQVRDLGWQGEIKSFREMTKDFSARNAVLIRAAERLKEAGIPGDMAELGVYRGDFAAQLNLFMPERRLYLFDTFEGFAEETAKKDRQHGYSAAQKGDFSDTSAEAVLARMPYPERVVIKKGLFPASAEGLFEEENAPGVSGGGEGGGHFCLVSLDADLYESTLEGLRFFWPRLSPGGMLFLHDWGGRQYAGVRAAVKAYEQELSAEDGSGRTIHLPLVPLPDIHGTAVIVKG